MERLSPVLLELAVEVPVEKVSAEVNNAYSQLKKTARVRGFRKGKAPRKVLAQLYGPAVHADVVKRLVDETLQSALKENDVQPLTQPDVQPAELNPKEAFSFKARFEVRPEVEKVTWEGLEAERPSTEVTDELVSAKIEQLRLQHAVEEPVEDRAAEKGDMAQLTIGFDAGGEPRSEEVNIEVGEGRILDELDEGVPGMKPGGEKEVKATLPAGHPDKALAGKAVTFTLKLEELKKKVLPAVDDEFAKDCDHDDLAALKTALGEAVQGELKQRAEEEVAKKLVTDLCAKNPIPVPPSLVEQQRKMSERELMMMAQMSGQRYVPDPNLLEQMRGDAEMKVRAGLLMAEIAKEKEVKVTPEDLEKGYQELAEQSGKNVAKIKAEYREQSRREMLVGMILEDKVLDLMEQAAKITDAK